MGGQIYIIQPSFLPLAALTPSLPLALSLPSSSVSHGDSRECSRKYTDRADTYTDDGCDLGRVVVMWSPPNKHVAEIQMRNPRWAGYIEVDLIENDLKSFSSLGNWIMI